MREPDRRELLRAVWALPAARPLKAAVDAEPGVHLVGGSVRDLLLGGEPSDLDLVVVGDPIAVARRIGPDVVVHDRFGTSTVVADGHAYDIARARRETYARPGALPDVTPAGLEDDLGRRDFTVNAMAVALDGPRAGELTAYSGALEDLTRRLLRVLHDRSFVEDPTRLLRLARYRGRLRFAIDPHTRALAAQAIGSGALGTVSGQRIGHEIRLLAAERDPVGSLLAMRELALDRAIHPGFGLDDENLARSALALLPADARPDRLAIALAARHLGVAELAPLLDRLGFDAIDRDAIVQAATRSGELSEALRAAGRPSEIAAAASGARPEAVAMAGALGAQAPARDWLERLRHVGLEIDGRDLLAAGVAEGPAVGRALRAALSAKLDGEVNGRDEELAVALESLGTDGY